MRNHTLENLDLTEHFRSAVQSIFGEDERMLNAQQVAIDAHPGYDFYNLNIDAGGLWVRRILDKLVLDEQTSDFADTSTR
jgi:phenylpropionate dioxygenase-like ring-hydroxylating dioxygenase large terminal subunit